MRPWLRRTLFGIFGASVLLGGMAACSHRGGYHGGQGWQAMSDEDAARMRARMIERVGEKLDLDAAQKDKLGVLADRLREQRAALVAGTSDPRAELQALVAGPTFDRARANAFVQSKTEALRGKSPEVIAAAGDFYDGLRPEQQAKVREYMSHGRRGWWHRS
jgi:Spy/CpxP family protein refolding chaperone